MKGYIFEHLHCYDKSDLICKLEPCWEYTRITILISSDHTEGSEVVRSRLYSHLPSFLICLFGLLLYFHGKQLRSCRGSHLLINHTVPRQPS